MKYTICTRWLANPNSLINSRLWPLSSLNSEFIWLFGAATGEGVWRYMISHKYHPRHTNFNDTLTKFQIFRVGVCHHKRCLVLLVVGANVFYFDFMTPNCTKTSVVISPPLEHKTQKYGSKKPTKQWFGRLSWCHRRMKCHVRNLCCCSLHINHDSFLPSDLPLMFRWILHPIANLKLGYKKHRIEWQSSRCIVQPTRRHLYNPSFLSFLILWKKSCRNSWPQIVNRVRWASRVVPTWRTKLRNVSPTSQHTKVTSPLNCTTCHSAHGRWGKNRRPSDSVGD